MMAVSESLSVSISSFVLFLSSPVVRKGPCLSSHVHQSEELFAAAPRGLHGESGGILMLLRMYL